MKIESKSPLTARSFPAAGNLWLRGALRALRGLLHGPGRRVRSLVERFDIEPKSPILQQNDQTLEGSFSAVSTATIATKYSFCRVFRDLQDLHSFAPLHIQNLQIFWVSIFFRKMSGFCQFSLKLVIFVVILMKIHRNFVKFSRIHQNL